MTTLDNWPRVKRVLEEALARDGAERQAFLAQACGTDGALRARVDSLLAASDRVGRSWKRRPRCFSRRKHTMI